MEIRKPNLFGGITGKLDQVSETAYRVKQTAKELNELRKLPLLPPKKAPKEGLYINGKPAPFERFDWSDDSKS